LTEKFDIMRPDILRVLAAGGRDLREKREG
jgi:hypothetical protein